jgi:hypothetical protein
MSGARSQAWSRYLDRLAMEQGWKIVLTNAGNGPKMECAGGKRFLQEP